MARHMAEPVKTFSVGFAEAGRRTSWPTRGGSPSSSAPNTTSSSSRSRTNSIDLEELVWHLDEPLADLSALGFLGSVRACLAPRHRRAVRPGGRRAPRGLHAAPRSRARRHLAAPARLRSGLIVRAAGAPVAPRACEAGHVDTGG